MFISDLLNLNGIKFLNSLQHKLDNLIIRILLKIYFYSCFLELVGQNNTFLNNLSKIY